MKVNEKVLIVIPARYASTRFPGKPLALINGKSMIERVYTRATQSELSDSVIVATDDQRIFDHVKSFGGEVVMTSNEHPSGTDRIGAVIGNNYKDIGIAINVQGDEPYISPKQIDLLISCFTDSNCEIATLIREIDDEALINDPNVVKVVRNKQGNALYFSRAAIPFSRNRNNTQSKYYQHIGIYGYRTETLKELVGLDRSSLEKSEELEQLRWIENGYSIRTAITTEESYAIDVPEDIQRIETKFSS